MKKKEQEMKQQLSAVSSNILTKINSGVKLDVHDVTSPEFSQYIQEELEILVQKFDESKKVLLKVL